jgi:hypothetical protein
MGASSSSKTGCDRKICRDFWHKYAISLSCKFTRFPGRALFTTKITLSQDEKGHGAKTEIDQFNPHEDNNNQAEDERKQIITKSINTYSKAKQIN